MSQKKLIALAVAALSGTAIHARDLPPVWNQQKFPTEHKPWSKKARRKMLGKKKGGSA